MAIRALKITQIKTPRGNWALEKYLQEIGKVELITPEEEVKLAIRIKQGDQNALEKLTKANLRFVVSVAKQYQHQGLTLPDLINEGNLGLIKAAQRFDETRGFKFISFAVWWIRQSILQALAEKSRMVRLPQNKISISERANKAYAAFEQEHEYGPSPEELAEILDMDVAEVRIALEMNIHHTSLDAPIFEGEDVVMGDLLKGYGHTDEDVMKDSLKKEIQRIFNTLSAREADVVTAWLNLDGDDGLTVDDVMQKYGLTTRERVRQLYGKAIKRLQKARYSEPLKAYLG